MKNMGIDINKYFEKTNDQIALKKLFPVAITDIDFDTYKIKPILKDKINFQKADMFEVLKNHKDESNTLVLCRNVLGYYSPLERTKFLNLLAEKLKPNSMVVIGSMEVSEKVDTGLLYRNFAMLTQNIFRKIR